MSSLTYFLESEVSQRISEKEKKKKLKFTQPKIALILHSKGSFFSLINAVNALIIFVKIVT